MNIPITKPYFGKEEQEAIVKPLETGWVVQGPNVAEFERKFSEFTGAKHSVATSNCTTAMHLAVAALGLKPGDEVIVPAYTWVATANVVEYMGAKPVFCDVELSTYNLDIEHLNSIITPRTVGIMPVHLFGLSADMQPIMDIARKHHLWVVEDAACSLGGWYHGQHTGTFGEAGCFSFHPRKPITTGEGGMLITNDDALAKMARSLRDHGATKTDFERHHSKASFLLAEYNQVGYNYRMTDMQGALGSVQMDRLAWILEQRRFRAKRYDDILQELLWLRLPVVPEGYIHSYQTYVTLFVPEEPSLKNADALCERRNAIMLSMEASGVMTRQGSHAPALLGFYVNKYGIRREDFPNSFMAEALTIALPLFPQMTDAEQDYVVDKLVAACDQSP